MSIMSERNRIDKLLMKCNKDIYNKVVNRITHFKTFAGIEFIPMHEVDYIVYNELEKVLKETKMEQKTYEFNFMKSISGVGFMILIALIMVFATTVKAENISDYIDMTSCNKQDRKYYTVCWDDKNNVPVSGWTTIDGLMIDKGNIKKRPNFFKDKIVQTGALDDIDMPYERGHTFANDADNDYSNEALKSTYNMINITPQLDKVNTGIWRKIESRGNDLAKKIGEVESITIVEYSETKINNLLIPSFYTRIYLAEDVSECYRVPNIIPEYKTIKSYKVNCEDLLIHK